MVINPYKTIREIKEVVSPLEDFFYKQIERFGVGLHCCGISSEILGEFLQREFPYKQFKIGFGSRGFIESGFYHWYTQVDQGAVVVDATLGQFDQDLEGFFIGTRQEYQKHIYMHSSFDPHDFSALPPSYQRRLQQLQENPSCSLPKNQPLPQEMQKIIDTTLKEMFFLRDIYRLNQEPSTRL